MIKERFLSSKECNIAALILRVGLGLVFIIGGLSKLSLLLSIDDSEAMVANYMGASGYINALFQDFLFSHGLLTPWGFLTALSAFEFVSGCAFVAGFLIRPLSILYAFLLWSFVVALPVETVPYVDIAQKTYTSPAIMVQIRDITLSGMMFVLFALGSGVKSVDVWLGYDKQDVGVNWEYQGLLLRLSLGITFIVAGFFGGYAKIATFATPQILLAIIGLLLIFGHGRVLKITGAVAVALMLWYMVGKLTLDKGVIANLNSFKREFALAAAGMALFYLGGGYAFSLSDIFKRAKHYFSKTQVA